MQIISNDKRVVESFPKIRPVFFHVLCYVRKRPFGASFYVCALELRQ